MKCQETVARGLRFSLIIRAIFFRAVLPGVLAIGVLSIAAAESAPLRYQPKADSKLAYKVEIVADYSESVETSKGVLVFEVISSGDMVELEYEAALSHSAKQKPRSKDFFSVLLLGPLTPMRNMMHFSMERGKNQVLLTPVGKTVSVEGYSQLPYLLGDLAVFVFEPLSEKEEDSWTSKIDITILKGTPHGWFRRPFPHPHFYGHIKRISGSESTSLKLISRKGDLSTFEKTYKLHSSADKESYDMAATGTWIFNSRLHMPESMDSQYKMSYKQGDITLSIPVTVKYHRLSDGEYAKYVKERKEKQEKLKEEHERRLAYNKTPLEGDERQEALADLKSNDRDKLIKVLTKISGKSEREDKEIADAIKPLLHHSNGVVQHCAERALEKFSPSSGRAIKIKKEYSRGGVVNDTGPQITEETPLPSGLIVAANRHGPFFFPAKVIGKLDDGMVELQFNNFLETEKLHFSRIRLAPAEVDQPFVDKKALADIYPQKRSAVSPADNDKSGEGKTDGSRAGDESSLLNGDRGYRTWTDDTGTFAVIAKYVGVDGDKVRLQRKQDGKEIKVPLARLSRSDRELAERLQKMPQASNPFE